MTQPFPDFARLTEAEWGAILDAASDWDEDEEKLIEGTVQPVVERIIADRMARAWVEGHDACCGVYLRHCATARNPYTRDGARDE